jgi:hypothetical protein
VQGVCARSSSLHLGMSAITAVFIEVLRSNCFLLTYLSIYHQGVLLDWEDDCHACPRAEARGQRLFGTLAICIHGVGWHVGFLEAVCIHGVS